MIQHPHVYKPSFHSQSTEPEPTAREKLTFFTGTGRHRVQIIYFLWGQIGSRTPSGIGLGSGSRLRRMRQRLVLSRELWIENFGKSWSSALERQGPWEMYLTLEAAE